MQTLPAVAYFVFGKPLSRLVSNAVPLKYARSLACCWAARESPASDRLACGAASICALARVSSSFFCEHYQSAASGGNEKRGSRVFLKRPALLRATLAHGDREPASALMMMSGKRPGGESLRVSVCVCVCGSGHALSLVVWLLQFAGCKKEGEGKNPFSRSLGRLNDKHGAVCKCIHRNARTRHFVR